jgi:hypothetical protein
MWEVAFQEYVATGLEVTSPGSVGQEGVTEYSGPAGQNFQQWSDYPGDQPPTTEEEFVADVIETLAGTGATLDPDDLALITSEEWESFLAALLGFVGEPHGADQNSYYADHSNEAPLGDYFIQEWGWLPSVRLMPGYHYFDYLTEDIDPEFLEWAYVAHEAASVFAESDLSLADIENIPFQLMVDGRAITIVWHSGVAPAANLHADPNDPNHIIVDCSNGYFSIQAQPPGPSIGGDSPPAGINLMQLNEHNAPYLPALDQALRYLSQDPLAVQVLIEAFHHQVKIRIVTGSEASGFENETNTVLWNPSMGLTLTNGGVMSPAMILLHELAHGAFSIFGWDAHYDTLEDRYIIEHYERIIGAHLGEPIRDDHHGRLRFVPTVIYHLPPPPG